MRLKYLLDPSSSLLILSKRKLKQTNEELYKAKNLSLKLKLYEKITNANSWMFIPVLVFIISMTCFIDFNFSNWGVFSKLNLFELNADFVDKIIDNRINNIITMTSLSFTVAGWLITLIKDKSKETIELLIAETKLYPIVYYIFSVIGFLLIVSFLRNNIERKFIYTNLMTIGMWLILFAIVCLGYLFRKLVQVSNTNYLNSLAIKDLSSSVRQVLYQEKIKQYSYTIFKERFERIGNIVSGYYQPSFPVSMNLEVTGSKVIKNVDIKRLEGSVRNLIPPDTINHIVFLPPSISEQVSQYHPRTIMFVSNQVVQATALRAVVNQYIETGTERNTLDFEQIKSSLFEKAKMANKNKDITALDQALASYDLIYDFYFKN